MDKGTPQTHPSDAYAANIREKALRKRIAELEAKLLEMTNNYRALLDPSGTLLPALSELEEE